MFSRIGASSTGSSETLNVLEYGGSFARVAIYDMNRPDRVLRQIREQDFLLPDGVFLSPSTMTYSSLLDSVICFATDYHFYMFNWRTNETSLVATLPTENDQYTLINQFEIESIWTLPHEDDRFTGQNYLFVRVLDLTTESVVKTKFTFDFKACQHHILRIPLNINATGCKQASGPYKRLLEYHDDCRVTNTPFVVLPIEQLPSQSTTKVDDDDDDDNHNNNHDYASSVDYSTFSLNSIICISLIIVIYSSLWCIFK